MKLSTKGRYAVMAMADLATHGQNAPISLPEIAERQGLPVTYLEQLFVRLRRHGLVESTRGQSGGYKLLRNANGIKILDIIRAVDEPLQATRCKPGAKLGCQGNPQRCLTHDLWHGLDLHIRDYLASRTLADLKPVK